MRQCVCLMSVEELFYLLTYFTDTCCCGCHGYWVNKWKSLIGPKEEYSSLNLARKLYTANELIFAEYCEFHACRKRGMKSGYQR